MTLDTKYAERHECMDEYALPLIWLAVVLSVVALASSVVAIYEGQKDRQVIAKLLADCANGKLVPLGNDAVMRCEVQLLVKER